MGNVAYATGDNKVTQNEHPMEDLRVRRTRKSLQDAFIELTIQKGFEAVTVRDITERAMVNRATFYRHFQDKYDLLERYMEDLYLVLDTPEPVVPVVPSSPPAGLVHMMEHLQAHAEFYRTMLGPKGYLLFAEKIREYIEKRIRRSLPFTITQSQPGQPPQDLIMSSITSASMGSIRWWLENGTPYTPYQMAAWAVQLSYAYLKSTLSIFPSPL
jgi:AcrR family transcriptional regulator